MAALQATEKGDDPLLLVLAADHVIQDSQAFADAVNQAVPLAESSQLVTFGIVPTTPETGYGYIQQGDAVSDSAFKVAAFVEKPNFQIAQMYLNSGQYYWNSGMFLFRASCYLSELGKHCPEMLTACRQALASSQFDLDFIRLNADAFAACPDDSIDYAVMEKTQDAVVVPMDAKWSDVGSWSALWEINNKDDQGNAIRGDVLMESTTNSYVNAQSKLVATVGVDNLVVVETKDAVLVAHKDKVQDVKGIVGQLKKAERAEHLQHREVYRPWGAHDSIAEGDRFHVKHLVIKPGQKTATQLHCHRAEHWVVVAGTAKVTKGEKLTFVSENESVFIPVGITHSIENPGVIPLELIEVRSGSYLGEDDVIRTEEYGVGY